MTKYCICISLVSWYETHSQERTYVMMEEYQKAYVAGIIDSEGSISLSYAKRGKTITYRSYKCKIKMCDDVVIPTISEWIGKQYNNHPNSQGLVIETSKNDSIKILTECFDYLYIKQPRARIFLDAANMRNGNTDLYTSEESKMWHGYHEELKKYNQRGVTDFIDDTDRNHKFHWAWLAGLIDDDGSVTVSKWTRTDKTTIYRPSVQLSLTSHKTIRYLAMVLDICDKNSKDARPNRKQPRRIRLMSNDIIRIMPNVIPYLIFKKELAVLALDICTLRKEIPNGKYNHKNVVIIKEKIELMKLLNEDKYVN